MTKNQEKWALFAIAILVVLVVVFLGMTSQSPANDISTISFNCNEWIGSTFSKETAQGFNVSFEEKEYVISNVDIAGKHFYSYSNECDAKGCQYLGELTTVRYSGTVTEKPANFGKYTVVLVDNSDIVYRCAGRVGA